MLISTLIAFSTFANSQSYDTALFICDTIMSNESKHVNSKFEKLDSTLQRIKIKEVFSKEIFPYFFTDTIPNDSFKIQSVDLYFQDTKKTFYLILSKRTNLQCLK
jgi:hypothetical protein